VRENLKTLILRQIKLLIHDLLI